MKNVFDLSEEEINKIVFTNIKENEPRGLLDIFTNEQVMSLPNHPKFHYFTIEFQDWVWKTIDGIMVEDLSYYNKPDKALEDNNK